MSQSIKNTISVLLERAKFNLSLFDKHSEKSKLRFLVIKLSKNSDYSVRTISKNFDKTKEEPISLSKKDFKFVKLTGLKLSEIIV